MAWTTERLTLLFLLSVGRFSNATSPAGKASRHLSGCGSQPELPHHAFSSFAAGKLGTTHQSSKQAAFHTHDLTDRDAATGQGHATSNLSGRPSRGCTPEQTDSPAAADGSLNGSGSSHRLQHAFSIFAAGKGRGSSGPAHSLAGSRTHSQTDSPAAAMMLQEARLTVYERSPDNDRVANHADGHMHPRADLSHAECARAVADFYTSPGGLEPDNSPADARLLSGSTSSPPKGACLPSVPSTSPFKDASKSAWEEDTRRDRPARRNVSAHFGSLPKRHKSVEADELPLNANPCGVLGGLVNKLKPQRLSSDPGSSANEDFDIDLSTAEDEGPDCMQDDGTGLERVDNSSEGQHALTSNTQHDPIAGLEHIQPFASIANVAVANVKAASLQRFGMMQKPFKKGHDRKVLQPFAPPRRCNASHELPQELDANGRHRNKDEPPALQQFACDVDSNK